MQIIVQNFNQFAMNYLEQVAEKMIQATRKKRVLLQ